MDIVEVDTEHWWIDTWDNLQPDEMETCAVYCDPRPEHPQVGDSLWWDDDCCYWTPADGSRSRVILTKIGPAGAPHPNIPPAQQSGGRFKSRRTA